MGTAIGVGVGPGFGGKGAANPDASILAVSPALWLRSGLWTVSGGNVTSWTDQSGHNNPAQMQVGNSFSSGDPAFNGAPSITFNKGLSQYMGTASNVDLTAGWTLIFCVATLATSGTRSGLFKYDTLVGSATGTGFVVDVLQPGTTNSFEVTEADGLNWYWAGASGGAGATGVVHVWSIRNTNSGTSAGLKVRRDQVDVTSGGSFSGSLVTAPSAAHPIFIGAGFANTSFGSCSWSELVVVPSAITDGQVQLIEARVKALYGTP